MKNYVAVVSHDAGAITKYQDFDVKADANQHVATHGGKVVEGIDDDLAYWDVSGAPVKDTAKQDADNALHAALGEIARLESLETPRRIAEATLTDEGKAWLQANRDLIAAERSKL